MQVSDVLPLEGGSGLRQVLCADLLIDGQKLQCSKCFFFYGDPLKVADQLIEFGFFLKHQIGKHLKET